MIKTSRHQIIPYTTKDGSGIRELLHPAVHGTEAVSLAEATVPPGTSTFAHRHMESREIYYVVQGLGLMHVEGEAREVRAGDSVWIPPGSAHFVENTGGIDLVILCVCVPPYSHEDTRLVTPDREEGTT